MKKWENSGYGTSEEPEVTPEEHRAKLDAYLATVEGQTRVGDFFATVDLLYGVYANNNYLRNVSHGKEVKPVCKAIITDTGDIFECSFFEQRSQNDAYPASLTAFFAAMGNVYDNSIVTYTTIDDALVEAKYDNDLMRGLDQNGYRRDKNEAGIKAKEVMLYGGSLMLVGLVGDTVLTGKVVINALAEVRQDVLKGAEKMSSEQRAEWVRLLLERGISVVNIKGHITHSEDKTHIEKRSVSVVGRRARTAPMVRGVLGIEEWPVTPKTDGDHVI